MVSAGKSGGSVWLTKPSGGVPTYSARATSTRHPSPTRIAVPGGRIDRLALLPARRAQDLPAGGSRLLPGATGYKMTIVGGMVGRCDDRDTGERPGPLA